MSDYILEMKNITKVYDNGIVANDKVNFNMKQGEIHALVGENGAGKTTLMKILFGMEAPSEGSILLDGQAMGTYDSKDAIKKGIGMVHQHFMLVDEFTVAQNIMLNIEEKRGLFTDVEKCIEMTEEVSRKYNLIVDPRAKTGTLPVGIKQKIEILKALVRGAKILILDEPTAVLTPQETELLFSELIHLKEMGYSIIFISHKIREVKKISSRITVMRNSRNVGAFDTAAISEKEISNLIMGLELNLDYSRELPRKGDIGIRVKELNYFGGQKQPVLNNINFVAHYGMILGIAGVQGNGQVQLIQQLTKSMEIESGDVIINNKSIKDTSIAQMRQEGFAYIPEDRLCQGVGLQATIAENLISNRYERDFCNGVFLNKKAITEEAKRAKKKYEIKCINENQKVSMLSGGNMQKVVVARECSDNVKVIIAEQPTRGIDIGAAYLVHKALINHRNKGAAVLLISADLNEVMQVCDALMVMYAGEIVAYFDDMKKINEEELGLCMLGIKRHSQEQIGRAANG